MGEDGRQLGRYRLVRLLGEGGMATVYEAEDTRSRERVALKLLRPELSKSEDGRRRFLQEMRVLDGLVHPNVVRSLGSEEIDGQLVLVLELLPGKTLRQVFETEPDAMTVVRAIDLARGIAAALVCAHERTTPVVHRDLKPENLMVLADGIKVMDFGIAKVLDDIQGRTSTTQTVGTAQYMSPEQADAKRIGPAADLYGLGLCLYEMVAGRPPFRSDSLRELLTLQCTAPPPPLPDEVSAKMPSLEPFILRLLEKEPSRRPSSAREALLELERLRAIAPVIVVRHSPHGAVKAASATREPETGSLAGHERRLDTVELVEGRLARRAKARSIAGVVAVFGLGCALVGAAGFVLVRRFDRSERATDPPSDESAAPAAPSAPTARVTGDAHLAWEVPSDWKEFANGDLLTVRAYRVPRVEGDPEDGELVVRAPGKDPEAMIATMRKTFAKCSDGCDVRTTRTIRGVTVTIEELRGVYFPIGTKTSFRDWAMLYAVIQVGDAQYAFRLTGPEKTIAKRRSDFDDLVASFRVK